MDTISKEYKVPVHKSVKFKFAFTFIAVMLCILLVLNIYPVYASEDMMFRAKKSSLSSQISVISTTLSGLETMDGENVSRVMELIDLSGVSRCIITDNTGVSLYDTEGAQDKQYILFASVVQALNGYDVFYSEYTGGAIHSTVAVPVMFSGRIIGSVYLYDYDETQASLLEDFQTVIRTISIIVAVLIVVISVIMSGGLTRRINDVLAGVRVIRQGDYGFRLKIKGGDELAQLSSEFNNMTDTLERTEVMRRRFVSDASHELKTPLASIRLLTDSILQTEEMDTQLTREFVSDIGHEAERLTRMTEKLLKITRLTAAEDGEQWHKVDISDVIETAIHMLRPLADTGNIKITFEPQSGCCMNGMEDDIYQIVFNLVENAIKYNVIGGEVRISVSTDGDINRLNIDDTGIGIPKADQPRIFERFYRVDKARSRETGGSGLGLAIVNDTVEKYGGSVTVSISELGGTRFTVILPKTEGTEK